MPPCIKSTWEENSSYMQAHLLAYNQRREYDDAKEQAELVKASIPRTK